MFSKSSSADLLYVGKFKISKALFLINPFPHTDAFENIVAKEEIAHDEQFLLFPQWFPFLVIGYQFNNRDFPFFDKICSKSSAADFLYVGKC